MKRLKTLELIFRYVLSLLAYPFILIYFIISRRITSFKDVIDLDISCISSSFPNREDDIEFKEMIYRNLKESKGVDLEGDYSSLGIMGNLIIFLILKLTFVFILIMLISSLVTGNIIDLWKK